MGNAPELIVMLTHNDLTVHNAYDIEDHVSGGGCVQ